MSFETPSFTTPFVYVTDECVLCRRPRRFWGNRNGWCIYCLQWYRRNGSDWILRTLDRAGAERLSVQSYQLPRIVRVLVLDYVAGSTRVVRQVIRRRMWERILLGKFPYDEEQTIGEYPDYLLTDEEYFARQVARASTPPFWKLQLSFRPHGLTSGENLIKTVIRFLS